MLIYSVFDGTVTTSIVLAAIGSVFAFFFVSSTFVQSVTWFLLFHLSYYNISNRIRKLKDFIQTSYNPIYGSKIIYSPFLATMSSSLRIKKLRSTGYIFNQICLASNEVNAAFSLTVLLNLITLMLLCATSLFFFIFAISSFKIPDFIENTKWGFLFMILIILMSAQSPINEVIHSLSSYYYQIERNSINFNTEQMKELREKVLKMSNDDNIEKQELIEVFSFFSSTIQIVLIS